MIWQFFALLVTVVFSGTLSWKFSIENKFKVLNTGSQSYHKLRAQGFGKPKPLTNIKLKTIDYLITQTRPGQRLEVTGSYANILARQCKIYEATRQLPHNSYTTADIYCRAINTKKFCFIGKVAYNLPPITLDQTIHIAIRSIELLLLEYAKSLRYDLALPTIPALQLWYTAGNSELQVAQNLIPLLPYRYMVESDVTNQDDMFIKGFDDVGFEPEVYKDKEQGFCCERDDRGFCTEPPVKLNFMDPNEFQQQQAQQQIIPPPL